MGYKQIQQVYFISMDRYLRFPYHLIFGLYGSDEPANSTQENKVRSLQAFFMAKLTSCVGLSKDV